MYRAIANIPGAEINPEVRELFNNLLVASSEVEMARQRRAQFEMYSDPNQRVTLAEFLAKINEEANKEDSAIRGIYVPEEIVNGIDSGELKLSNMTVAQFDAIEGAIRELYTLGRNVASMELDGERVAFESARSDISQGIVDNLTKKGKGKLENRERTGQLARIKEALQKIGLSHARIPSLFKL